MEKDPDYEEECRQVWNAPSLCGQYIELEHLTEAVFTGQDNSFFVWNTSVPEGEPTVVYGKPPKPLAFPIEMGHLESITAY